MIQAENKIKSEIFRKTEKILEFNKVKDIWKELALTEWAKEEIEKAAPYLSEGELLARLHETTESRLLMENAGTPPLVSLKGIADLVMVARKGGVLSAAELEEIEVALVAVKRLKDYLNRSKIYELSLPYYEENLDALTEVREEIQLQIRGGRVDDNASKLLKSLRSEIERTKDKMKEKADSVMRAKKECMSDSFSTFRNGHLCVPVKKECKFQISGSVIDKSSSGNTLFIEPSAVAKYNEELQLLKIEEENEERRILYSLTALVSDGADTMEENIKMIEKLDFIFSKGKLSQEFGGTEPQINTDRRIVLKAARHPLMDRKICVPLNFQIGEGIIGVVITGPNTGGKTVALKTVALACIMAQCGLHVACEAAEICMNSSYLCDIGDGQNISENLSTFSAHIMNVLEILKEVNRESLVIMDELGSGTDPTEGMGIAIAILEELKESGALFLVTTHYPDVKQYAEKEAKIVNARMTFDKESLKPLYQMIIGEAGESCALSIAKRLGMPDRMLRLAERAAYGANALTGQMAFEEWKEKGQGGKAYQKQDTEQKGKADPKQDTGQKGKADSKYHAKASLIQKRRQQARQNTVSFQLGDSVMVFPDKKIGIVCQTANENGAVKVQLPNKKIWVNHKRLKLWVAAAELYPEDYDFSILFDTVENRKLRHQMEKHHVEGKEIRVSK